jgi:hypothetical protein
LFEGSREPICSRLCDLRVQNHIEICLAQPCEIDGAGTEWRNHMNVNAKCVEKPGDLCNVIAVAETESTWTE